MAAAWHRGTVRPVERELPMTEIEAAATKPAGTVKAEPFRFFDNREKYLLFVMTTSEKAEVAARIGRELGHIVPRPPALRVFDAGTGNGMVLSQVLRDLHRRLPTVPFFVVGKEVSMEDTRLTLATLPDRLAEHPQSVDRADQHVLRRGAAPVPQGRPSSTTRCAGSMCR